MKPVFSLTLWLISEFPNFFETIVLKTINRHLCALNFVPIWYLSIPNVIFSQIFYSYVYYIAKTYLPLFQHIADSLKKIGFVGTVDEANT